MVGLRFHEDVMQCFDVDLLNFTWVPSRTMPRCAASTGSFDMQTLARLHGFKRSLSQSCWRHRKEVGTTLQKGHERIPSKGKMDGLACRLACSSKEWIAYPGPLPVLGILFSSTEEDSTASTRASHMRHQRARQVSLTWCGTWSHR